MQEIYSIKTLNISHVIEKIDTGELGLPDIQRPFVWKDTKVRDLFDSLMRGYPVGYLMLWQCPEQVEKRSIGTGNHIYDSPKEVIIDGQQRLTSLYAIIKGKEVLTDKYMKKFIVLSYRPLTNEFAVATPATQANPEWIYNITDSRVIS